MQCDPLNGDPAPCIASTHARRTSASSPPPWQVSSARRRSRRSHCRRAVAAHASHATAEGKCGEGKCGDERRATIDADHDGRVSLAEAQAAAPGRAAELAKKDVDHDGFISARESYESIKALYEANGKAMPAGRFKAFDK
jgi:ribosomal protein L32